MNSPTTLLLLSTACLLILPRPTLHTDGFHKFYLNVFEYNQHNFRAKFSHENQLLKFCFHVKFVFCEPEIVLKFLKYLMD